MQISAFLTAALLAAALLVPSRAPAAPPPVQDFFDTPEFGGAQLSPNGRHLAAKVAAAGGGRDRLAVVDLATMEAKVARDDADLFVAELTTWPESRLATCNYAAGVMSAIIAEVRYPTQALQWNVDGEVVIAFNPAAAEIAVTLNGVEQRLRTGLGNGDRLWERDDRPMGSAFKQAVRTVADRAVQRYPKPAAIPAGFPDAQVRLVFTMADPEMPNWHN
ncbi:hypothetical protein [Massilia sp. METH4]|uniref:hypothetical protein n=1 Tax=Massilia sp. METH4 TaxID=3123041 RepID=UPI0030CB30DF